MPESTKRKMIDNDDVEALKKVFAILRTKIQIHNADQSPSCGSPGPAALAPALSFSTAPPVSHGCLPPPAPRLASKMN